MKHQTVDWKSHGVDPLALVPYMARLEDIARAYLSTKMGTITEEDVLNQAAQLGFKGTLSEVISAVAAEAASIHKFTQEEYAESLN
jgi:hypothetical protein